MKNFRSSKHIVALSCVAQLAGASSCKPNDRGFDSWLGHMPELWVRSPVSVCAGGN